MSKEIKYTDVVPNSIVTRYKEDNIQYLLDQVARLTAENAMLKEKWSAPKQPEQKQEPVAWLGRRYGNLLYEDHGYSIPLYTAPPKREPLTPQQISEGNQSMLNVTREAFKQGVIFAEKAHGIGGGE